MNELLGAILQEHGTASQQDAGPDAGGDDMDFTSFGACIRALRQRAGLSLTEMSARVGVSVSHYHRIEFDQKAPLDSRRWGPLVDLGADASILSTLEHQSRVERRARRRSRHHMERKAVAAGLPGSSSWDELGWEEDDWCWYTVACHPHGLTIEQVAALTGYTSERVRQIELEALAKLATEPEAIEGMEVIDDRENQLAIWANACADERTRKLDEEIAR